MKIIAWPAFKMKYQNPYGYLLYSSMKLQEVTVTEFSLSKLLLKYHDILHLHWPIETIVRHPNPIVAGLRAISMLLAIDVARARGTKVIWTHHDKRPHSILHPQLGIWFQSEFIKRVDGCISHCQVGREWADLTFPTLRDRPHSVIPLGHYRQFYPDNISREAARKSLDIPSGYNLLLFLGNIDNYKNVPYLLQVFQELAPTNWILLIAGKLMTPKLGTQISQAAANDSRIRLQFGFVPDEKLQEYFRAAGLMILPFKDILNSASALLALSFNCPVLVPQKGAMGELQEQVGQDWVKLYSGELTTDILESGLEWAVNQGRAPQVNLEEFEWSKLSQQTIETYQKILSDSWEN